MSHRNSSSNSNSGLCTAARAIGLACRLDDSIEASLAIVEQLGELLPLAMRDVKLKSKIDQMNHILKSTPDETICNMQENSDKRIASIFVLFAYLAHVTYYRRPWLVGSLSLRMVDLTMKTGLYPMSPVAFAIFGGVLSSIGYVNEGFRLGESFHFGFYSDGHRPWLDLLQH